MIWFHNTFMSMRTVLLFINKSAMWSCIVNNLALLLVHCIWVIFLNLVHTGSLRFLVIFYKLPANEHGFLPKTRKI